MTPATLLTQARADGVELVLEPPDQIKLRGPADARAKWLPVLRPHKPELLALLTAPDPLPALYREWLADLREPHAVVTLTETQAAQAVAAGAVHSETARTSVLVAIRSPLGAVGLMAIPKDRYDGFALIQALEAAPWVH